MSLLLRFVPITDPSGLVVFSSSSSFFFFAIPRSPLPQPISFPSFSKKKQTESLPRAGSIRPTYLLTYLRTLAGDASRSRRILMSVQPTQSPNPLNPLPPPPPLLPLALSKRRNKLGRGLVSCFVLFFFFFSILPGGCKKRSGFCVPERKKKKHGNYMGIYIILTMNADFGVRGWKVCMYVCM